MPARKKPAAKRRTSPRGGSSAWLIALTLCSLAGLGISVWLLQQERQKNAPDRSLTEKALKMAGEHPDAEVFQLDPEEKKK